MTISVKHKFTSAKSDSADTSLIRPSNWNDEHDLTLATDRLLGRDTAAAGAVEEISVAGGLEFTGTGGIQRSALTGDVTASAGSNTTTIANDAVTYAKMQNVSVSDRILGRQSAGAGDVEEITCTAAGRALLDDADAAAQRTTLGLVIGTNVQAYDAELAAIAGLTSAADRLPYFTGSGTAALATFTTAGRALVDDADAAAQRTTLGLGSLSTLSTVGTTEITNDAVTYAKIQNVSVADRILGRVTAGAGDIEEITCTAAGRALIDDADAAAQRTTLGLGTLATASTVATANITDDAVTYAKIQNVSATDRLLGRSAAGSGDVEEIVCTAAGRALIDDADAATQRTTLGLVIGTNVQAYDAELAAIAGLTSAADTAPYFTGAGTAALMTVTAAGRALIDDASASAQRTTLGLGTMATETAANYATLASPALTGTPTAPSAAGYTDSTQIATTAQVYDTVTTVPENAQTGTSYTLVLADAGKMVTLSNAAAITLTIPTNASVAFPVDTRIDLIQYGAGQVTVGGAGVTIRSSGSKLKLAGQYSGATLWKKDTDEWVLIGDITS